MTSHRYPAKSYDERGEHTGPGTDRRTVYHSCKAHQPSGLRLAASVDGAGRWRWSVYDMTQGSRSGGLLVAEGLTTSWPAARRLAAGKALTIWKRAQRKERTR